MLSILNNDSAAGKKRTCFAFQQSNLDPVFIDVLQHRLKLTDNNRLMEIFSESSFATGHLMVYFIQTFDSEWSQNE